MAITRRTYTIALLTACVVTRLLTTIYYVEDTDSLRFALSVYDRFDVTALQPHFPGYPVFWAAAKSVYLLTGSFAVAFSLVGGLATFGVVYLGAVLSGRDPVSVNGLAIAFVLFFNPMIWLMGNRYMPDLLGLAVALGALWALTNVRPDAVLKPRLIAAAGLLTGLLAGTRLSYLPFILPAYLLALRHRPAALAAWSVAGAAVWLIPLLINTGWGPLIEAAGRQTEGHFTEFGGTVDAHPDILARGVRLVESLWADGFGGWWPGRHALTLVLAGGLLVGTGFAAYHFLTRERHVKTPSRSSSGAASIGLLSASIMTYVAWIFLFQNVIYKSRHALPLVALCAIPVGLGVARLLRTRHIAARAIAGTFLLAYAAVTIVLVGQHRRPTAIAQAKQYIEATRPEYVASIPLVNYYLSAQGVQATFLSVQDSTDRRRLAELEGRLVVVGHYPGVIGANPVAAETFYHNPYVNRMWAEVEVFTYGSLQTAKTTLRLNGDPPDTE